MKPVGLDSASCPDNWSPDKDTEKKTTVQTTRETDDMTAPKRIQGEGVDPYEIKRLGQEEMTEATSKSDEPKTHVASLRDVDNASWHDDSSPEFHNDTEDKTAVETTKENGDVTATNCVQGQDPSRERKSRLVAAGVTEKDIKAYDAAVAVIHGSRWSEVKRATERNTMLHEAKCWNSILRQRRQDASWKFKQRVCYRDMTKKRRAMDDEADVSCAKRRKNDHHTTATSAQSYGETEVPQWIEHEKRKFVWKC
ncbi:hypothetical protein AC1031_015416 [Aphanomyces cochlioides]|nr:hypothetical protein AC1031_015416 [Aphanomyces cochlioides]